jgi:RNA polymerase sigma factor (sigma-70 family)
MGTPTVGTFLRRLRQAMAAEALVETPDRELVERFRADRDEAAFRALVDRHGPMVFQVCRRSLASHADVEDAFQATFLVLVRRGHTIRRQASVASWLHGVAHRTALKLRTEGARRRRREERFARPDPVGVSDDTPWGELRGVLDEELGRLPDACRAALVLCYLEGRTQDEAAAQLGRSKSTLRRHLDRGRILLRRRLGRRGVALGAALAARLVSDCAVGATVPRSLLVRTAASASHTAAGRAAPAVVISPRVAALTDGVTKTMISAKFKMIAALLACGLALGVGVREFGPQSASAQDAGQVAAKTPAGPDVEPIDPKLVFEPEVQKHLHLSPNQIHQLTEARDKSRSGVADQTNRVAELDKRMQELQNEINRLSEERNKSQQAVEKAESDGVKKAIPKVLSKDAVAQLQQMTLQRMRLSDILLDPRVRSRLDLNDEQVKKIQEVADRNGRAFWSYLTVQRQSLNFSADTLVTGLNTLGTLVDVSNSMGEPSADLLKILTHEQRESLEKLSGTKFDKKK